jgi:phosphate starvation-inducible protein PhoH
MFQLPSEEDFEMLYGNLKTQGTISFWSTSFLRGSTFDNCILIVDEFQNANFHELSSIITRVGENCKIMFCGDASQSDLVKTNERNGIIDFMSILRIMPSFDITEFGIEDVVRSSLVKEFLIAKHTLGL